MAAGGDWVTWHEAADIVGCPVPTIDWYTLTGRIQKRPFRGSRPTLRPSSVEEFARWWRDRQRVRAARRAERLAGELAARDRHWRGREPPEPAGWETTTQAGVALGVTTSHVVWLIGRGRLDGR